MILAAIILVLILLSFCTGIIAGRSDDAFQDSSPVAESTNLASCIEVR